MPARRRRPSGPEIGELLPDGCRGVLDGGVDYRRDWGRRSYELLVALDKPS